MTMECLVGKEAADAFQAIVASHIHLVEVSLVEYPPPPRLQERVPITEVVRQVLNEAVRLRSSLSLPFWDCVMLSCEQQEIASEPLLDAALFHRRLRGKEAWLTREAVLAGEVQRQCARLPAGPQLAATSEVRDGHGSEFHIPLLDMHCSQSAANLELVERIARRLMPEGSLVLESDKSYHLYGRSLLTPAQLIDFLAQALLFSPIVDRTFIAHQLLERRCILRLTAREDKKHVPTVTKVLS